MSDDQTVWPVSSDDAHKVACPWFGKCKGAECGMWKSARDFSNRDPGYEGPPLGTIYYNEGLGYCSLFDGQVPRKTKREDFYVDENGNRVR